MARSPLVIREAKGSPTLIERMFKEADSELRPNIVLRCESPAAVKAAVKNNMGIGLLFLSTVEPDFKAGKFKQVRLIGANLNINSYIVHRKPTAPLVAKFVSILRQKLRASDDGRMR